MSEHCVQPVSVLYICRWWSFSLVPIYITSILKKNQSAHNPGSYRDLVEYLNESAELLAKNGAILDNVLETLDMQQHSLGVLYVLVAKFTTITGSAEDANRISQLIQDFIAGCISEHIRLAATTCKRVESNCWILFICHEWYIFFRCWIVSSVHGLFGEA